MFRRKRQRTDITLEIHYNNILILCKLREPENFSLLITFAILSPDR